MWHKKFFLKVLICGLIVSSLAVQYACAQDTSDIKAVNINSNIRKVVQKKDDNNFQVVERVEEFPEVIASFEQGGKTKYQKTISLLRVFNRRTINGTLKTEAYSKSSIIFTYDKENFVSVITVSSEDKVLSHEFNKYHLMAIKEILPSDLECLVSVRYGLYKQNVINQECIDEGHLDVICTPQGSIKIKSDID